MPKLSFLHPSKWPLGQLVRVHQNLNNGKWTVKHGSNPVFHCDAIHLKTCVFHVSQLGRQRVLDKKQRAVHASVSGIMITRQEAIHCQIPVSYNPYRHPYFQREDTGADLSEAYYAAFETRTTGEGPRCYINDLPF